ncbi:dNA-directed RNA polymerase specialized sigma subunit sigma24 homolog [Clostridium sp. CAG:389]|nr:dNA-directed RNA polymerase specialized sigma subunit sigma24 homolog [Clostridium sp. CAG:389]
MEDKELIYKIQHGNKELLEILIEKYYDDIYRFCYYKTGNSSLSYDLTQETFLKLIKYIGTYKHRGKFKSYLITISMNVCNTYFDENKVELEELDDNQTYKENDSNELSRIEQKNSIDKALKELPEKQKEVIILKYYEDLKIKDISKILDEKVPTIKSRLKQGIEKLSRYLGKEDF